MVGKDLNKIKSSLCSRYYAERLTNGGADLRCLAPGQHTSEEMSQRWRTVGNTVPIRLARESNPESLAPVTCA